MKNKELAQRIKILRNRRGLSQEELADKTGLSLRTIQRVESGETEPRGDSLKRLAAVFEVSSDEIVDWTVKEDKGFLMSLNLSSLSFVIFPLLGIMVPLIIWISKKDKIKKLNDTAKDLLNFQITWTMGFFVGYIGIIFFWAYRMKDSDINAAFLTSQLVSGIIFMVIMYLLNVSMIIFNTFRINSNKNVFYQPKIRFF